MTTSYSPEVANFSLVKGGPSYRLMLGLGLIVGDSCARMAVFFSLLTWLPLLILSAWEGMAMGNRVSIPFLSDFAAYARFLVSLPLLVVADTFVDPKLGNVLRHFGGKVAE